LATSHVINILALCRCTYWCVLWMLEACECKFRCLTLSWKSEGSAMFFGRTGTCSVICWRIHRTFIELWQDAAPHLPFTTRPALHLLV
jgi:hypothetical protein